MAQYTVLKTAYTAKGRPLDQLEEKIQRCQNELSRLKSQQLTVCFTFMGAGTIIGRLVAGLRR
eukprot:COSAG05_NODE_5544_length_1146_cov_0.898758_2_plen_63_part_00